MNRTNRRTILEPLRAKNSGYGNHKNPTHRSKKLSSRISPAAGWRRIERSARAEQSSCSLCGMPLSCECRTVFVFSDAEFNNLPMRLAVYDFAWTLNWPSHRWRDDLLNVFVKEKVKFTDITGRVFDLDLSVFEAGTADKGADEETHEARWEEALRSWFRYHFRRREPWTIETLPKLSEAGKRRFKTTASILVAVYPELEQELIRLANDMHR